MRCVILPPPLVNTVQYSIVTTGRKIAKSIELKSMMSDDLPFRVVGAEGVEPPTLCL